MTYRIYGKIVCAVVLLGMASACTVKPGKSVERKVSVKAGTTVSVRVKSTIRKSEPVHRHIVQSIRRELVKKLRSTNNFKSVAIAPANPDIRLDPADYRIIARVVKVDIVSDKKRLTMGRFAGHDVVMISVSVTKKARPGRVQKSLGSFKVFARGPRDWKSEMSYGPNDPLRKIVDDTVRKLKLG